PRDEVAPGRAAQSERAGQPANDRRTSAGPSERAGPPANDRRTSAGPPANDRRTSAGPSERAAAPCDPPGSAAQPIGPRAVSPFALAAILTTPSARSLARRAARVPCARPSLRLRASGADPVTRRPTRVRVPATRRSRESEAVDRATRPSGPVRAVGADGRATQPSGA